MSWIALRGECRNCGAPISIRYPLVEALVGLLFLGAYLVDVVAGPRGPWWVIPPDSLIAAAYHAIFLALLVAATFIDYDLMMIPDQITVTGMVIGIALGTLCPGIRPAPATADDPSPRLPGSGCSGLAVGAGLDPVRPHDGRLRCFRREAMGLGDVTLLGMVGAFLGWQAAVLTFFLAPFFGLAHAAWKLLIYLEETAGAAANYRAADREIPYGPYLSMAAATLLFVWPWLWRGWAAGLFGDALCDILVDTGRP